LNVIKHFGVTLFDMTPTVLDIGHVSHQKCWCFRI